LTQKTTLNPTSFTFTAIPPTAPGQPKTSETSGSKRFDNLSNQHEKADAEVRRGKNSQQYSKHQHFVLQHLPHEGN